MHFGAALKNRLLNGSLFFFACKTGPGRLRFKQGFNVTDAPGFDCYEIETFCLGSVGRKACWLVRFLKLPNSW
ncbi:MAG: hypothetical protein EAY75_02910 [Bacteroidetes bacterium]|nr:MAG: hypothetical protein EAY75_02910 [Bacteroidota bacterium]